MLEFFLANLLLSFIRTKHETAIPTETSGIAVTLLMSGTTFHNRFGIPILCFEDSSSSLKLRSICVNVIKKSFFIIIDEVSMIHRYLFYLLDIVYSCNVSWEILN